MNTIFDEKPANAGFSAPREEREESVPPTYTEPMAKGTSLDTKNTSPLKDKMNQVDIDVQSVNSSTSTLVDLSDTLLPNLSFTPVQSLHIAARGIAAFRLPLPSSELEIDICHSDGTIAYTSTRARRSKGDCILAAPNKGDLISTNYFFGPSKQPVLRDVSQGIYMSPVHDNESTKDEGLFSLKSKWTSRSITLVHRESGRVFEWSYDKVKTADGKKANLLVLRVKNGLPSSDEKSRDGDDEKILAQLIRSDKTRTPGSRSCSAGNGGQLVLGQDATAMLSEPLIVATCLMMLKKEIDRRRAIQFAMLAGAAGGGGS